MGQLPSLPAPPAAENFALCKSVTLCYPDQSSSSTDRLTSSFKVHLILQVLVNQFGYLHKGSLPWQVPITPFHRRLPNWKTFSVSETQKPSKVDTAVHEDLRKCAQHQNLKNQSIETCQAGKSRMAGQGRVNIMNICCFVTPEIKKHYQNQHIRSVCVSCYET